MSVGLVVSAATGVVGATAATNSTAEITTNPIEFVYVDGSTDHVTFVRADGTKVGTNVSADVVGPMADLDGDGKLEAPYVTSQGEIHAVDVDGGTQFVANRTYDSNTKLGVGDWTGDGTPEVLYANTSDGDTLYYANVTGTPTQIAAESAVAVLGAVDFDGEGSKDLVYVGASDTLKYYNGSAVTSTAYTNFGSSATGYGAGAPADFRRNGTYWVPAMDGSAYPELVDASGNVEQLSGNSMQKAPVAGVDWAGDDRLELLHLKSGNLKYTYLNGTTKTVNDADGNNIGAVQSAGVAGVADRLPEVERVTVSDGDDNGLVGPGEQVTATVTVSGDVDSVSVDLTAFGAGTPTTSVDLDGGTTTVTVSAVANESDASTDGSYSVTATASDTEGNTDLGTSETALTLDTIAPTVDAGDDRTVEEDTSVSFSGSATDAHEIASHQWSFGTGDTATGQSVSYTYDSPGTYTVTLEVTDAAGNIGSDTLTVSVEDDSTDSFDASGGSDTATTTAERTSTATKTATATQSATSTETSEATSTETPAATGTETPEATSTETPASTASKSFSLKERLPGGLAGALSVLLLLTLVGLYRLKEW